MSDLIDQRLEKLFEDMDTADVPAVPSETKEVILKQMRVTYANTLQQAAMEMRIANKLEDDQMKSQIRTNARRCVVAIDEIDVMLKELTDDGSGIKVTHLSAEQMDADIVKVHPNGHIESIVNKV